MRRLLSGLVVAIVVAIASSPLQHVQASTAQTYIFVNGTYQAHTTRSELLNGLAKSRAANATYLATLHAAGTPETLAEEQKWEGGFAADSVKFSAYPNGPVVITVPMVFVRRGSASTMPRASSFVTNAMAAAVDTMSFDPFVYDTPYGTIVAPVTNFTSNASGYPWYEGSSSNVNWDLLNSPYQPWLQSAPGSYAIEQTLVCEDIHPCAWSGPDYSVSIGPDYGGTRLHARLWGYGAQSSDGHDFTIADAHQDSSVGGAHCLSDITNPQNTFQYTLSPYVYSQSVQDFGNAANYSGCSGSNVYFNGQGKVHWVV